MLLCNYFYIICPSTLRAPTGGVILCMPWYIFPHKHYIYAISLTLSINIHFSSTMCQTMCWVPYIKNEQHYSIKSNLHLCVCSQTSNDQLPSRVHFFYPKFLGIWAQSHKRKKQMKWKTLRLENILTRVTLEDSENQHDAGSVMSWDWHIAQKERNKEKIHIFLLHFGWSIAIIPACFILVFHSPL